MPYVPMLQVIPVPRQAIAAATLAVEPDTSVDGKERKAGDSSDGPSVSLCEKMVRLASVTLTDLTLTRISRLEKYVYEFRAQALSCFLSHW